MRYRSNLLGADLRITNFGGGNTSSKIDLPDPFTGKPVRVLAVKGSGGDLGSINESGFALLYLDRLEQLKDIYRGEEHEDEMVRYYPLSAFGENRVAASIDTPLHAFLPFPHVDHLHPDWAIALAASANGKQKLEEFNKKFGRKIVWLPWQRPGFELALLLEKAVQGQSRTAMASCSAATASSPGATPPGMLSEQYPHHRPDGRIHPRTPGRNRARYSAASRTNPSKIDAHVAAAILPALRGIVSSNRRVIAHYADNEDALTFAGSKWAQELGDLGTSCPDHFLRTRICPMFVDWKPGEEGVDALKAQIEEQRYPIPQGIRQILRGHATTGLAAVSAIRIPQS